MIPEYLTPLLVESLTDTDWRIFADFRYRSAVLKAVVVVPQGFVTDFASVPRVPLAYWLAGGIANKPACIHDWLYRSCGCPRADADAVFKEAMELSGIVLWRRQGMYMAVRTFGEKFYCKKQNPANSGVGTTTALLQTPPPPINPDLLRSVTVKFPQTRGSKAHNQVKEIIK